MILAVYPCKSAEVNRLCYSKIFDSALNLKDHGLVIGLLKITKKMKKILLLGLGIGLFAVSCQKENQVETTEEQNQTTETAQFETLLSVDENIVDETYLDDSPESFPLAACATVVRDTTTTPRTITIDYGTTNCLCRDGRFRRGIVVISYTGTRRTAGSNFSVAFNNYFVNDNAVTGSISGSYTLNGTNPVINRTSNITITTPANVSSNRTATRTIEMIAGYATPGVRTDDVFLISGSSSMTRNGVTHSQNITTPLRREGSCNWLVSGVMTTTHGTRGTRTIDYGNGTCDNQATVTMNGRTRTITLP